MDKQKSGGRFYEQRNFSTSRRSTGCQPAKENMKRLTKLEAVLWSIAFPGFPQLLAGEWVKGILLVVLEICVNLLSLLMKVLYLVFQEKRKKQLKLSIISGLCFIRVCICFRCGMPIKWLRMRKKNMRIFHLFFQLIPSHQA